MKVGTTPACQGGGWGVRGGVAGYPVIPASLRDQLLASVLCIDILFCLSKAEL